jgi:hypothetical protein
MEKRKICASCFSALFALDFILYRHAGGEETTSICRNHRKARQETKKIPVSNI